MQQCALLILCVTAAGIACTAPRSATPGATSPVVAAPAPGSTPPGMAEIRQEDLRRDLYALGGDDMRGREAGTLDELRAGVWVAERAREAGLEPAGDDGTYFQFWPMRRVRLSGASHVSLGGRPLALWKDAVVVSPADATLDVPIVFVGEGKETDLAAVDLKGKAAAALLSAPANPPSAGMSLSARRYTMLAVRQRAAALAARGAAAILLVSDSIADPQFDNIGAGWLRGRYGVDSADSDGRGAAQAPVIWLRRGSLDQVRAPNARLALQLSSESFVYPSMNIVARVRGADPSVRDEYVLYSGHHDHDGVRFPVGGDSIWNGADDNASVSVALLGIGRALAKHPTRRSALFVWHGAEERGLLGSRWFSRHPTVRATAIVAVLNADMIGRNSPDSAALLGSQPPHRNSAALVTMALEANAGTSRFAIDSLWDRPTHPEGWYFRSDHLPYARAGIPAVEFSTLLHPDYHTPRDEPSRIDYGKLTRVAQWMYATGWAVGNAVDRVRVDPGFKLER